MYHCLQVDDLKYLGFACEEVPKVVYLLFQRYHLLSSHEEIWERRKQDVLALKDPTLGLQASWRQTFLTIRDELEKVFKKYIKPNQIIFRSMPAGNEHVLRGFTDLFVIDVNIVCNTAEVHKQLEAVLGPDNACHQVEGCQCLRRLLNSSMTDALSRQKKGPSKERILHNVMAGYMEVSKYDLVLPKVTSAAASPVVSHPGSAPGNMAPAASTAPNTSHAAASPQSSQAALSGLGLSGLSINNGNSSSVNSGNVSVASSSQPDDQPSVRIIQEPDTPVVPGPRAPLLFHNGIQASLAAVLQHSAGHSHQQGVVRSSVHPSDAGYRDTVTLRLCPERSKHNLVASQVPLISCLAEGSVKPLYFPKGFEYRCWSDGSTKAVQELYYLLERLHALFLPGVPSVNMYYDADDGIIAFNMGNKLWYNAHADHRFDKSQQSFRLCDWYITVCHELAHNFHKEHDEVFSEYLAQIALQHSTAFYTLCHGYGVNMNVQQV